MTCPFCQTELNDDSKLYLDEDGAIAGCGNCILETTVKEYEDGEL